MKVGTNPASNQFKWKWKKGAETSVDDFLSPGQGSATYRVCLYDSSGHAQPLMQMNVSALAVCDLASCWKPSGSTGFSYRSRDGTPDGLTALKLKAGITGKANVQAKGKGRLLPMPPLGLTLPVTAQLVIANGSRTECWQTTYATAILNDPARFKAKGP